jgi:hypothetical protein
MCCFFTALLLLGPRAGILIWWLLDPTRWQLAFTNFIWAILGFIFLPWTTLMYALVFPGGIVGFDWIWLGLGLLVDIGSHVGGGYTNRDRIPGVSSEPEAVAKTPPPAAPVAPEEPTTEE